jgi:hypothetical protein
VASAGRNPCRAGRPADLVAATQTSDSARRQRPSSTRLAGRRAFELPLVERTRALYRSIYDYAELFPESLQLLHQVAYVPGSDDQGRGSYRAFLAELLRDQLAELGWPARQLPDILATMFMALGEATARRCFDEPGWNCDALVELLTSFTLGGLASIDSPVLEAADG